jgi:hypothetical protein
MTLERTGMHPGFSREPCISPLPKWMALQCWDSCCRLPEKGWTWGTDVLQSLFDSVVCKFVSKGRQLPVCSAPQQVCGIESLDDF